MKFVTQQMMNKPLKLNFAALNFIPKRVLIGFSGGLDSRVLFDLLYHDPFVKAEAIQLVLVNVNHHTDPREDVLSQFAAEVAQDYKIPVHLLHVKRECPKGESIEAFMRQERYQLFDGLLQAQDVLVTAHHLDDQAETFLLNLMRGAGMKGLRGMAQIKPQGLGYLWRPLLAYSKQELLAYAEEKNLTWREDPTNQDLNLDRVFLRQELIPVLLARWPKAQELLVRAANNIRSAQEVLENYLHADIAALVNDANALDLKKLKTFSKAQGLLLLKTYLDQFNYRLGQAQLQQIYQDFVLTNNDAEPLFEYQGVRLVRRKHYLELIK